MSTVQRERLSIGHGHLTSSRRKKRGQCFVVTFNLASQMMSAPNGRGLKTRTGTGRNEFPAARETKIRRANWHNTSNCQTACKCFYEAPHRDISGGANSRPPSNRFALSTNKKRRGNCTRDTRPDRQIFPLEHSTPLPLLTVHCVQ